MPDLQDKFLLEVIKISSLLIITVFTILFAIVPVVQKEFKLNPWIINCSQSLYCGMFLSITFLDFFPRAMNIFNNDEPQDIFPMPFIVSLCSYTLMLIFNKLFLFSRDFRSKKKHVVKDFFRTSISYERDSASPQRIHIGQWDIRKFSKNPLQDQNDSQIEPRPSDFSYNKSTFLKNNLTTSHVNQKKNYNSFLQSHVEYEEDLDDQAEYIEYNTSKKQKPSVSRGLGTSKKLYAKNSEMIESHQSSMDSSVVLQKYRYLPYQKAYYIMLVFSFQSLVEGLSVGVQNQIGTILFLTMATLLHKFIQTSMLSVTLILHKVNYNQLTYILCIYSLIQPIGICIGWIIQVNMIIILQDQDLLVGFIIAFVAGNFLYITASEGIIDLFEMGDQTKKVKMLQFLILLFGVGIHFLVWFSQKQLDL